MIFSGLQKYSEENEDEERKKTQTIEKHHSNGKLNNAYLSSGFQLLPLVSFGIYFKLNGAFYEIERRVHI